MSTASSPSPADCLTDVNQKKAHKRDACMYAYCPVLDCHKQWYLRDTLSQQGESIPLLPDYTMHFHAMWPWRCHNMMTAIWLHYEEYHPNEELPLAVTKKLGKQKQESNGIVVGV